VEPITTIAATAVVLFARKAIEEAGAATGKALSATAGRLVAWVRRLGRIYALERIAKDSVPDGATIAEVLTAFVRGRAPWPPARPDQPGEDTPIQEIPYLRSAADVQAALTVLGRQSSMTRSEPPKAIRPCSDKRRLMDDPLFSLERNSDGRRPCRFGRLPTGWGICQTM